MTAYVITNTAGSTVATINTSTTTGTQFPIELVGQGISLYGGIVGQDLYRMLENFALGTAPTNPVIGMNWYNSRNKNPYFYNGVNWIPYATGTFSNTVQFDMLPAATGVDLTTAASTTIFQAPGTNQNFHVTNILLLPNGAITASTPAAFNLNVTDPEDVLENVIVSNMSSTKHANFSIDGVTASVSGTQSIKLTVSSPASGGTLKVNVFLFGYISSS